jgi:hypothetical protein
MLNQTRHYIPIILLLFILIEERNTTDKEGLRAELLFAHTFVVPNHPVKASFYCKPAILNLFTRV